MTEIVVPETEEAICPNCCEGNRPTADFCRKCGAPLTVHATTDPMGQIFSAGFAYWQGTHCARSRIILVGMWLLFLPELIIIESIAIYAFVVLFNEGLRPWWPLWKHLRQAVETCVLLSLISVVHSVCTLLYGTFLYKTTRSYFIERKFAQDEDSFTEQSRSDAELAANETDHTQRHSAATLTADAPQSENVLPQDNPRTILIGFWIAWFPTFLISACGLLTIVAVAIFDIAIRSEPIGYTLQDVFNYFLSFTIGCAITGGFAAYVGRFLYNKTSNYLAFRTTAPATTPL